MFSREELLYLLSAMKFEDDGSEERELQSLTQAEWDKMCDLLYTFNSDCVFDGNTFRSLAVKLMNLIQEAQ